MIPAERFIVEKSTDFEGWLAARRHGVTATQVANAATPAGYEKAVADFVLEYSEPDNPYMRWGRDWESFLADWAEATHGVLPNEWLIAGEDSHHLATPDGLAPGHTVIGEYKTTGKDWGTVDKLPIRYRRQVQWQLHVTGADTCLVVWLLRETVETEDGLAMVPAWFEPKWGWVTRDDEMIGKLVDTANRLWKEVGHG
jgi:hypothetical protein